MIRIDNLTKVYGDLKALDGLSLQVEGGEILGLVGPNGAGKTTALRCLCGVIPPTSGQVTIEGLDLEKERVEARRRLAFVPDEPRLFDYLTAWDYLMVIARLYGVADGAERATALLQAFDLGDRRRSFPGELSRGMKQKLVIAAALLHRPRLLVLDEPLTGLDPGAMRRMKTTIRKTAEEGVAVIVSSHMLQLVQEICQRVLILQKGRKILEGSLEDIRRALPEDARDADLEEIFLRATGENEP